MSNSAALGQTVWELPPLILHPFNEKVPPAELLENSKAALMLSGLIPNDGTDPDTLRRKVLAGRYAEIRMLYFLGKDVFRWIGQCVEHVERVGDLTGVEIQPQSFAGFLAGSPPEPVQAKLKQWGVVEHTSIFARAIGLNTVFQQPPEFASLSDEFLRHYHKYADYLFACYQDLQPHRKITAANFRFELYASGEYSRLLESEWDNP